jgi:hypothetical protein
MSEHSAPAAQQTAIPEAGSRNGMRMRRGCDCGQHTFGGHECGGCQEQHAPSRRPTHQPEPAQPDAPADEPYSQDLTTVPTHTSPAAPAPTTNLVVDDTVAGPRPEQLRRSEFLHLLRTRVTEEAEAALAGSGHTTDDCPYLAYWFDHYAGKDSEHVERAVRKYLGHTPDVRSAADYAPLVAARVRQGMATWRDTGRVVGLPTGLPPGGPALAPPSPVRPLARLASVFRKAKTNTVPGETLVAYQDDLGAGRPLDSGPRARMESAFGSDFGHVRLHTGTSAANLSSDLDARAFTIGHHVAFGHGEYRPGTLVGDAILAHELAHVVQQGGASAAVAPMKLDRAGHDSFEEDADNAAVGAVATLWTQDGATEAEFDRQAMPRLRSGLELQRCGTFSEHSSQQYRGFDSSVSPRGLVVPVGGSRVVSVRRSDNMTIQSQDTGIATVADKTPADGMTVSGVRHDRTSIVATEGTEVKDRLDVSVKRQVPKTVDYHFMSDSGGHSTKRTQSSAPALTRTLNTVWEEQANIHFTTGVVDAPRVGQDLGTEITATDATSPEWAAVTSFATGGDYNVFLVWELETGGGGGDTQGATASTGGHTLLEDDDCSDGLTIAHEAGHHLGLYNGDTHPNKGVMSSCGGFDRQRVYKADADIVNP